MDSQQMYNQSAMLHDAFRAKANESTEASQKQKFEQLAQDQKSISDRLREDKNSQSEGTTQNDTNTNTES